MHSDEQYGQQLGAQLREELDDVRAAPDLVLTLRRRRSRRTWTIRAAIATPLMAAAATVAIVTSATGHGARLQDVAYVKAQTIQALNQATRYVIYSKDTYSGGRIETWTDLATQRYRNDVYLPDEDSVPAGANGQVKAPPAHGPHAAPGPLHLSQSNSGSGLIGNRDIVSVDYDRKTWRTDHDATVPPSPTVPNVTDPDSVEAAINNGTFEVLGDDPVSGVAALHLRISTTARGYRIDLWVDKTTFLPIQETDTALGQNQGGPAMTATYAWLPRTDENLARLVLTAPPGFTRQH
jgi:hypothetical protein